MFEHTQQELQSQAQTTQEYYSHLQQLKQADRQAKKTLEEHQQKEQQF
jgi:hypothetical protein